MQRVISFPTAWGTNHYLDRHFEVSAGWGSTGRDESGFRKFGGWIKVFSASVASQICGLLGGFRGQCNGVGTKQSWRLATLPASVQVWFFSSLSSPESGCMCTLVCMHSEYRIASSRLELSIASPTAHILGH